MDGSVASSAGSAVTPEGLTPSESRSVSPTSPVGSWSTSACHSDCEAPSRAWVGLNCCTRACKRRFSSSSCKIRLLLGLQLGRSEPVHGVTESRGSVRGSCAPWFLHRCMRDALLPTIPAGTAARLETITLELAAGCIVSLKLLAVFVPESRETSPSSCGRKCRQQRCAAAAGRYQRGSDGT